MKDKIIPYLKVACKKSNVPYSEEYFTEMYYDYDEDYGGLVALKPPRNSYMTMEFSVLNGAFIRMEFWGDVKQRGEIINYDY